MGPRLGPVPEIPEPARAALVQTLHRLISGSRYATLDMLSLDLPGDPGRRRLSELVRGTGRFPEPEEVRALAQVCDPRRVAETIGLLYVAAAERTALAAEPGPRLDDVAVTGTVETFGDWAALGVHRPITRLSNGVDMSGPVAAGRLPECVLRTTDLDDDPATGLRATPAQAAAGTGPVVRWVVLTGESSAGKTRAAVEAMRAQLSGWRLLIPHGPDSLRRLLDQHPLLAHTVMWLDEIDQVLAEPVGVEQIHRLLALTGGPVVLLGTLRTDRAATLRGTPGGELLTRRALRIPLKRRPLGVELEQELARARESDAPWIVDALSRIRKRYGIAEWLAAGPQLLDAWQAARTSDDPVERGRGGDRRRRGRLLPRRLHHPLP